MTIYHINSRKQIRVCTQPSNCKAKLGHYNTLDEAGRRLHNPQLTITKKKDVED